MFRVVIVEDEDLIRKGLIYSFDWINYDCIVVGESPNGKDGLEVITELKPDIVITDIKMPFMDGLQMLEAIENRNFETVIITGYAEFEYAKKAIKYQVSEYLLKPINHDELGMVIENLIYKIKNKQMIATLKKQVKSFSDLTLLESDVYFNESNYECRYIPDMLRYIEDHYNKKISIEDLADELELSTTYLSRKFKEETKHTFSDFLNKFRIQKSLELMTDGDYKIYEIAEKVGFSEYKYFSQVFKNYMQSSPSEFLQSNVFLWDKD
ncbi:DNA-binding response regulator [Petrocella atlantisensis]|uniref:Stage 0 sporulation protein A homolog n=1 Tax=Petrocella atlantisensis TaxID=2173034 RepID=A0A3P7PTR5_9FIRM|nr:response regulator [Petrocella atlantisensis]VDN46631.1 DNA-binding response regulator [Petrocella atlantisensis]